MDECKRRIGDSVIYADDMYSALQRADALLLLTEWKQFRIPDWSRVKNEMANSLIVDGRNIYEIKDMMQWGFDYLSIGRTDKFYASSAKKYKSNIFGGIIMLNNEELIDKLLDLAFAEDIGDGDCTTLCCIPEDAVGRSKVLIKEEGILAGVDIAKRIFKKFDKELLIDVKIEDGAQVKPGDVAMVVSGKIRSLLQTERLMLNVMQRMSGIATVTHKYQSLLKGTHTKVLDTRKTTPGMRVLEKMAVKIGGGENHRMGLFDMILLKDNHVDFAGGIKNAIERCHKYIEETGKKLKIEIEVRNFEELQEVLEHGGVNRIMLDNFTVPNTRKAVEMIGGKYETESSGGITIDTIKDYAECGVDFVSVGALTHSVKSLDISFKAF